jgi:hypothetical protein
MTTDVARSLNPTLPSYLVVAVLAALLWLVTPPCATAATVWTGPMTNFTKAASADPTLEVNQDRITSNVWITRGSLQGIYNAKTESSFVHFFSPADTEWANGTTASYSTLSYTDWDTWAKTINGGPPLTVGTNAVMHLKSDDIYLDVVFTSWSISSGGSFSYMRSTPSPSTPPPPASILNPTLNGSTFSFYCNTQTGHLYSIQFTSAINPAGWSVLTNFSGTGSLVQVKDSTLANSAQFYRVQIQ